MKRPKDLSKKEASIMELSIKIIRDTPVLKMMSAFPRAQWSQGFCNGVGYANAIVKKMRFLRRVKFIFTGKL